jgi:mono/diheme cytochrome c family protein
VTTPTAHAAPPAELSTRPTHPRWPARNRRKRVSRLLSLALIASAAAVSGCGGEPTPPPEAARAGTQVFAQASCGGCHTLAAADARGQVGPNLDALRPEFDDVADQVRDGGKGMPAFSDRLTHDEIQSVAAYVAEVAGRH